MQRAERVAPKDLSRRDGAIVAWHEVPGKALSQESRPVGYGLIRAGERTFRRELPLGISCTDHTVPYGTVLSRGRIPGTSCQATIGVVPTGRCPFGFGAKIPRRDLL
jgi:hypothetical protein